LRSLPFIVPPKFAIEGDVKKFSSRGMFASNEREFVRLKKQTGKIICSLLRDIRIKPSYLFKNMFSVFVSIQTAQ
jgi:hypothetical protein